jgi:hypothetical protein
VSACSAAANPKVDTTWSAFGAISFFIIIIVFLRHQPKKKVKVEESATIRGRVTVRGEKMRLKKVRERECPAKNNTIN